MTTRNRWILRVFVPCLITGLLGLAAGCPPQDDGTSKARIASLSSKDWKSRVDKVDVLAESTSKESEGLLLRAMQDEHPRVREAAVKALARRKVEEAVPAFATAVRDPDEGVRIAAVAALQQFVGARAVSVVLLHLGSGSDRERQAVRAGISAQLKRCEPEERLAAIKRLAIMVKAESVATQEDAATILAQVGFVAVDPVLDALAAARPGSEGPWVDRLVGVLGRMGLPAVAPCVAALLKASDEEKKAVAAARGLARIGAPAVPQLIEVLDSSKQSSIDAADLALEALLSIGAPVVPAVTKWLEDAQEHRRLAGVELLQRLKSPAAVPALLALLGKEPNRAIRLAAVRALGNTGDPKALPQVMAALRKDTTGRGKLDAQEWEAYREALLALKMPAKELVQALSDPLPQVRLVAAQVVARQKNAEAVAALPALLKDKELDVLQAAALAAGALGAKDTARALRTLAYHKDITVRFRALEALGRLKDPKAIGDLAGAARFRKSTAIMTGALLALGEAGSKAGLAPAKKAKTKSSLVLRTAALWTLDKLAGKPAEPAQASFCGLIVAQKEACATESPTGDAFVDLQSICQFGDINSLEPMVQASKCKDFQAGLQRLAKTRGTELFTTTWGGAAQGKKRDQMRFLAGVRQGPIERWNTAGMILLRGTMLNGLRHGLWETFWANGKKRLRTLYVNDTPNGRWERWYSGGNQQEQGTFKNGLRQGAWILWHKNGQKAEELTYDQGLLEGKQLSYYPNGKVSGEALYDKGKRNGPWLTFYPDGKKRSTGQYVNGQRTGAWTWFHANGREREAGSFDKDLKTGLWTSWNRAGRIVERCIYSATAPPNCGP